MTADELPIGRRVARWRVRRQLTQQMLADRLRRSKSWVDKVERGVRPLDRYSVIQELAQVLRIDPELLLGRQRPVTVGTLDGVDDLRAALARYDTRPAPAGEAEQLRRLVGHAWLSYQHAHYPQLVRVLPGLLDAAQGTQTSELLVQAYRITSSLLVKLGEADLGWLAADRAMAATGGDPVLSATAAVSVGQALRALGRGRLALAATLAAAEHLEVDRRRPPGEWAVGGTLLLQAALAAAGCGDTCRAEELTERAAGIAGRLRGYDDAHRTGFGPVTVELARVVAAAEWGDAGAAVRRHPAVVRRAGWRLLPAECRGAYLLDVARAYLQLGDVRGAARSLVDADSIAPAEVRCRPSARTVIAEVARAHPAPAGVARLATLVGLTR
ncbi:XRE family transcriptional regulator [Micromonospora musae]|uniref:XRE family transcriptional regulator n=1 Tax=Micromonospora musae TaxID=1894970 RepID=A0A3A9YGD6_9ACTN|nr:transcriptional regulator [Micromonospora musae]RKN15386.1 XRE family transcriptional regulator [Micromonospora musae]RKN36100.1 XRE family transcriptional regulator [Micromonospora musae]